MTTVRSESGTAKTGRRLVLLGVAGLLCVAAALAIGILLFGDFGATEGRILATTALLSGFGLLALPAAILQDRRRLPALAALVALLATVGAALTITSVWIEGGPDWLGKSIGSEGVWLVASVQVASLVLRLRRSDPRLLRWLFVASCGVAVVVGAFFTVIIWSEIDSEAFGRAIGALVVLDALLVALQPIMARTRPAGRTHRLLLGVGPDGTVELSVDALDLATAAAQAIRTVERDGNTVLWLSVTPEAGPPRLSAR